MDSTYKPLFLIVTGLLLALMFGIVISMWTQLSIADDCTYQGYMVTSRKVFACAPLEADALPPGNPE